jgi:hypothetical protein
MLRRELPNAIDFPVATTFLPSPSRKLALDLANDAQSYANGLMKRPDFRFRRILTAASEFSP